MLKLCLIACYIEYCFNEKPLLLVWCNGKLWHTKISKTSELSHFIYTHADGNYCEKSTRMPDMAFMFLMFYSFVSYIFAVPPDEQRLLEKLLHNYNPASRPVFNASKVVTVKFGITLTQISDMVSMVLINLNIIFFQ